jgi:sn-glycerol 3-phosphate transport system substrate-binding protein
VSGYLPVTLEAYEATKASGFYEANPGREIPISQMLGKEPTENSRAFACPTFRRFATSRTRSSRPC